MLVRKNKRVKNIINLIETFKVANVDHVADLYYCNYKKKEHAYIKANERLRKLAQEKTLKRKRSDINSKYCYYIDKEPKQIEHSIKLTDLYVELCMIYGQDNIQMIPEYTAIEGVRPDAYLRIKHSNRLYLFYVEIHRSNDFDIGKYEAIYRNDKVFPTLLIVTEKKLKLETRLNYIVVKEDLEGLEDTLGIGKSTFTVLN